MEIAEFAKFATSRAPQKRVIFFRTAKATGASEFLRHLASNGDPNALNIYMDMATGGVSQLAEALKESRERSIAFKLGNLLQTWPLAALLFRLAPIASIGLSPVTRIGAIALVGLGEGILIEPFPSLATSRICRMATTWPKPNIFFYLDNAQKKAHEIIQLTRACVSDEHYAHVRFVLVVTDEFRRRFALRGFPTTAAIPSNQRTRGSFPSYRRRICGGAGLRQGCRI